MVARSSLVTASAVIAALGGLVAGGPRVARADDGADFISDAKLFYRVVACGSSEPLPAEMDAATVEAHCAEMAKRYHHYTDKYVTPARAFFAPLRPADRADDRGLPVRRR